MDYFFFFMAAVPVFASIFYWGMVSLSIYNRLDKNKEFRSKWSGYGGPEFWDDAKKINDPQLQKYIYTFEVTCRKLFGIGFIVSVMCFLAFWYFYG